MSTILSTAGPAPRSAPSRINGSLSGQDKELSSELGFPKFPDFPIDIQRYIFEMAYHARCLEDSAGFGDPSDTKYWSAIANHVNEWIEPLIYESMLLSMYWQDTQNLEDCAVRFPLYQKAWSTKPREFFTKHVRRIYTNGMSPLWDDCELKLLPICDNLTTLECWAWPKKGLKTILQTKHWPKLKTLCINLDLFPHDENTFRFPIFRNVTKLEFRTEHLCLPSWPSLVSLDNLTHLRVNMLTETLFQDHRHCIDQASNIVVQARKYFPSKLECFVVLVPTPDLYNLFTNPRETPEDEARWERMETIRLGTFDSRIMLGAIDGLLDAIPYGTTEANQFMEYLKLVPNVEYLDNPQTRCP